MDTGDGYCIDGEQEDVDALRKGATEFFEPWYGAREDTDAARQNSAEFFMPWYTYGDYAKAYIVEPNPASHTFITHQFDDVCCRHLSVRGEVHFMSTTLAEELSRIMQAGQPDKDEINRVLEAWNLECDQVVGQGLALLTNGWFLLTEGND